MKECRESGTLFSGLAPVEQAYFEKQIQQASARMNFKAALEKYNKKKGGA